MGRKNVVKSFMMMDSSNMNADITSTSVNVINMDKASIHIEWSGASVGGALSVEARNGEDDSWYELDFNVSMDITSDTGDHQIVFNELPFTDIRLRYNFAAGTGAMNATISMKVTGA